MLKNIASVIVGYILWTVIFLGGASAVRAAMPGAHDENGFTSSVPVLSIYLALSVLASLAAGFLTAKIANAPRKRLFAGITAVCLLATGIPVQLSTWDDLPVWYNLAFLILLVPATMQGAALVKQRLND